MSFIASWLVSKQSGACEQYLGTLRFLYRTIISGGVYEGQGGDMQSACLLLQHSTLLEDVLILSPAVAGSSYSSAIYFLETPGGRCTLSLIKPVLSHGCVEASEPQHSKSGQAGRNESHLSKFLKDE